MCLIKQTAGSVILRWICFSNNSNWGLIFLITKTTACSCSTCVHLRRTTLRSVLTACTASSCLDRPSLRREKQTKEGILERDESYCCVHKMM